MINNFLDADGANHLSPNTNHFCSFLYRIYPIFDEQITEIINRCKVTASIVCLTVQKSKRIVQKVGLFCS